MLHFAHRRYQPGEKALEGAFFMIVNSSWNIVWSSTAQSNAKRNSDQANIFPATISLHLQLCRRLTAKQSTGAVLPSWWVVRGSADYGELTPSRWQVEEEKCQFTCSCACRGNLTLSVCGVLQSEAPVSSGSVRKSWVMHGVVAVMFRRLNNIELFL